MTLTWSPEAIDDLQSVRAHIALDDPAAAKGVALHVLHSIEYHFQIRMTWRCRGRT
jgi:plasmid stabilization system protein ParE